MGVKVKKIRGSWYLVIDYHGRRKTKKIGSRLSIARDVARKVEARLALGDMGIFGEDACASPLLRDYADRWLRTQIELKKKHGTHVAYERMMRVHVLPQFGAQRLDAITSAKVADFVYELATRKGEDTKPVYTQSTVDLIVAVMRGMFSQAKKDGLVMENPAAGLAGVRCGKPKKEIKAMARTEAAAFLESVLHLFEGMHTFFLTALKTGLRRGELCGLHWGDIALGDAEGRRPGYIIVRRTWSQRVMGESPKSGKARRVDMSPVLRTALMAHRERALLSAMMQGRTSIADDLVFPGEDGAPLQAESIGVQYMEPALTHAGLPKFTIHELRHTYAAHLLGAGVSPAYVQKQMGHSSIKITVDTYGHWIPGENAHWVECLDQVEAEGTPATNANQAQTQSDSDLLIPAETIELHGVIPGAGEGYSVTSP